MASNFYFLEAEFLSIYEEIKAAEENTFVAPRYAALLCRTALEKAVAYMYAHNPDLDLPYDNKLSSMLMNEDFKKDIPANIFPELDIIRRVGNKAAHGGKVSDLEALQVLKYSFRFLYLLAKAYGKADIEVKGFDENYIPKGNTQDKSSKELQALAEELAAKKAASEKALQKEKALAQENEALKAELEALKARKAIRLENFSQEALYEPIVSEADTRRLLIDLLLKEAGWDNLVVGYHLEYKVHHMPLSTNPSGIGYVDYVLWDDNGKPLAIIEAKSVKHSAKKGKDQAAYYADALEKEFEQRPVIFFSNGYDTYIWDDAFYAPRKVQGFYNKAALQSLIMRRSARKDLRAFEVNRNIAGRPYQLEAIQRIAENFVCFDKGNMAGRNRKALLVMATGSGKTRTAAAIVEMMSKCHWAKRILFLADRTALVKQAKNAFNEYLPNMSSIDLTRDKDNTESARIVFSTYPTMMNCIDNISDTGERLFGIGHFDLIIIDEAHRSIYQKYQAIFEYFDAMLIGLTATPKKDIDKNTYSLFEIEDDNPTFAYELEAAVKDKYLVPPKAYTVPLKFPRKGIKYSELSEKDKAQYEAVFGFDSEQAIESGEILTEIDKNKINSFLFNTDTIDKVLDLLMTHGLKVESGDKLGKTIIFAKNHRHAAFIEERFNKNYPQYKGNFLKVIDNYNDKAQALLEDFCYDKGEDKNPQIAVSVDMMDTGVDAPRVLNLVFFKEVKSYAKYWQMIGRGTRLCKNVFGPGKDKEYFLIFDICENFEFFEHNPEGISTQTSKPLQQRLFESKLLIAASLLNNEATSEENKTFALSYLTQLQAQIQALDENRFEVRRVLETVHKYKNKAAWAVLTPSTLLEIQNDLSALISYADDKDEMAKQFDLLIYQLQSAIIHAKENQGKLKDNIVSIAIHLHNKANIPIIKQKVALLEAVKGKTFWQNISLAELENLRMELRHLVQFLKDEHEEKPVYTSFEDELNPEAIKEYDLLSSKSGLDNYRNRVEYFIMSQKNHLVIDKIYRKLPITASELEKLEHFLHNENFEVATIRKEFQKDSLTRLISSIVGLDIVAANEHFAKFIQEENLNANQICFVNKIISQLNKNGIIEKGELLEFINSNYGNGGIFEVFHDDDNKLHKFLALFNELQKALEVA